MNSEHSKSPLAGEGTDAIRDAAAGWCARRDRGLKPDEAAAYEAWLRADARHSAAVREIDRVWTALAVLRSLPRSEVPDPDLLKREPAKRSAAVVLRWVPWLAVAAAAAIAVLLWLPRGVAEVPQAYVTAVGAHDRLALADGSVIELNTDTSVEVNFSGRERRVRLVRGEALFSVAKDESRPFVVSDDRVQVRAVGTAFDVRRRAEALEVWVTEGKVAIAPVEGGSGQALASAGEKADVPLEKDGRFEPVVRKVPADAVARALAWKDGRLEFEETPLREVLAEFSRYHRVTYRAADDATGAILVGGSFPLDKPEALLRVLESNFGVAAVSRPEGTVVLRKTAGP